MAERSSDWLMQAQKDLEKAKLDIDFTKSEAKQALDAAERIYEWCKGKISS